MLVKLNPARSLFDMNSEIDRFFNSFSNSVSNKVEKSINPNMEIEETDNSFNLFFEIPGVDKKDIKIELKENFLTVSGEKKDEKVVNDENYHYTERRFGKFSRSLEINSPVVEDKISAEFKDGVLTVTLPKAEEAKPKQIEVKVK